MKATGLSFSKRDILTLVEDDLDKVEQILRELTSSSLPLINNINNYLHNSGGKRLRPAVLLLCTRLCGYQGEAAAKLASVMELIHVATLVHDDVIDNADLRRGNASVNARWGNPITVLTGDWMYMSAFSIALELRNHRILEILIDITRTMVEGELIQLENNERLDISAEEQLDICYRKTACLFSGCGRLAAMVSDSGHDLEERLAGYGKALGMAFQLTDDLLDYSASQKTLGKPVLKDLQEGRVTLPIISLLQRAGEADRQFVLEVARSRNFTSENKERLLVLVREYGTLPELQERAREYADRAVQSIQDFPDSLYREALMRIPRLVVDRDH